MSRVRASEPTPSFETLPLTLHLPVSTYAALVKIAEHRHVEARDLVMQLTCHAVDVALVRAAARGPASPRRKG